MTSNRLVAFASLLALSFSAFGCAPQQVAPPVASAHQTTSTAASTPPQNVGGDRHVYRFDFVLTSNDGTSPATTTAFTLNLQEFDKGEMMVGKNVPLSTAPTSATGAATSPPAGPRQDVGLKVAAQWRATGDDLLLEVSTEMSAFEAPSSIRKVVAKGGALASAGKSTVVTTMESDNKKYQLTVTPTKLR